MRTSSLYGIWLGLGLWMIGCQGGGPSGPSGADLAAAAAADPDVQGVLARLDPACAPTPATASDPSGPASYGYSVFSVRKCLDLSPPKLTAISVVLDANLAVTYASAIEVSLDPIADGQATSFAAFTEVGGGAIAKESFLEWVEQAQSMGASASAVAPLVSAVPAGTDTPCRMCQATALTKVAAGWGVVGGRYITNCDNLQFYQDATSLSCNFSIGECVAALAFNVLDHMGCAMFSLIPDVAVAQANAAQELSKYDIQNRCTGAGFCSLSPRCPGTPYGSPCAATCNPNTADCSKVYDVCARNDEGVFSCCTDGDAFNGSHCE